MSPDHFKKSKGAVLVELALTLPLLLLIAFGIFEFSRAMFIISTLNNAARECARRASVSPTTPLDVSTLEDQVKSCIPFDKTGLILEITPGFPEHGVDTIKVTIKLPFRTTSPILLSRLNGIILKGEASMLYE